MSDSTKKAKSVITLIPAILLSLAPATVDLLEGQSQQFTTTVNGTCNTAVTWSRTPPIGSISSTGLYTAPASVLADQSVKVTAQSVADTTKSVNGAIAVRRRPRVRYTFDASRLTSLLFGNQSYYNSNDFLVDNVTFRSPSGTTTTASWVLMSQADKSLGASFYQHIYNEGRPHQFTVKVVWSAPDSRTIRADAYVTNDDPTDDITNVRIEPLPFQIPGPATDSAASRLNIDLQTDDLFHGPVDSLSGSWGSIAVWHDADSPNVRTDANFNQPGQIIFKLGIENDIPRIYNVTGTKYYVTPIHPGETRRLSVSLRFGQQNEPVTSLAADALAAYRLRAPNLVQWPDRRPIANWFIAEGTDRTATNPRGYFWAKMLNASDPAAFHTALMAAADSTMSVLNSMSVRPQGVIIWDLEGQEFDHAFTYVGAPDKLPDLAPEMNAVADELFARFTNAGYRVGVTLRPQNFGTGTILPSTCEYGSISYMADKFIKTNAPFPFRSFVCTAPNVWTQNVTGKGPGNQVSTDDDATLIQTLRSRIAYAHSRWGATLFYVDSNVYVNGQPILPFVFRQLATEFPDCLIIPETPTKLYFGTAAPFKYGIQAGYETLPTSKSVYPDAFSTIYVADANPNDATVVKRLVSAVKSGDILLFRGWFRSGDVHLVETVYQGAAQ